MQSLFVLKNNVHTLKKIIAKTNDNYPLILQQIVNFLLVKYLLSPDGQKLIRVVVAESWRLCANFLK